MKLAAVYPEKLAQTRIDIDIGVPCKMVEIYPVAMENEDA